MKKVMPLNYKLLRKKLNPKTLGFKTTSELESLHEFIGQGRALEAVNFGIGIKSKGYNLYAMGPTGIGKRSLIRSVLEEKASKQAPPSDWCYIYNFDLPEKPLALRLPPGYGSILLQDMRFLIEELSTSILSMFESDEYNTGMQEINDSFNLKREKITTKNSSLIDSEKKDKIPHLYKERHQKEKELQFKFTTAVVDPLINKLKKKHESFIEVVNYLAAVQEDVIGHVNDLVKHDEITNVVSFVYDSPALIRYQVNLFVDNSNLKNAPVIFEENPSYSNLIGRIEHETQFGALATKLTLIRSGALHRANNGYLVIEARHLKKEPHAWDGLKRALFANSITIESIEHLTESVKPVSLEPMPIPLDVKVILLGSRKNFYSLCHHDPDFLQLFKVAVDFDEQIERNEHNIKLYARLIGTIIHRHNIRSFHAKAVAAVIDYSTRLAEDIDKLSTHIRNVDDLILEANYWASLTDKKYVEEEDVQRAINAQIHRLDRTRELYYEEINRNFVRIDTDIEVIGQVNCLSYVNVGNFSYGHPTRVTANVHMGKGKILDIQREIDMAGPIHAKAGLILSHYLEGHYNPDYVFSLSASISFEQIYDMMEGDSASVGELCALLSALASVPIKQGLALTGSIDQYGEVQAIGGVNEKIEGFFDICLVRGLTGRQGVLIPAVNAKNLMLREDVVDAAKTKKFFIYPIEHVNQALSLLTGMVAGVRGKNGLFTPGSVNEKVEARLKIFSENSLRKKIK